MGFYDTRNLQAYNLNTSSPALGFGSFLMNKAKEDRQFQDLQKQNEANNILKKQELDIVRHKFKFEQDKYANTLKNQKDEVQDRLRNRSSNARAIQTLYPKFYGDFSSRFGDIPSKDNAQALNESLGRINLDSLGKNINYKNTLINKQQDLQERINNNKALGDFRKQELGFKRQELAQKENEYKIKLQNEAIKKEEKQQDLKRQLLKSFQKDYVPLINNFDKLNPSQQSFLRDKFIQDKGLIFPEVIEDKHTFINDYYPKYGDIWKKKQEEKERLEKEMQERLNNIQ